MAEQFFSLSRKDQAELISVLSPALGMRSDLVEKDIWVCWALEKLFAMPERKSMAFKGGTSLSKVYKVIERFSEDIDITIDYRDFVEETTGDESRTKLSRLSETLKTELSKYANQKIKPHIEQELAQGFEGNPCRVELDESGEKFFIHYPSAFENDKYVEPKVLLEFGVRNVTIPKEPHTVKTYISEVADDISFPEANVDVLAVLRTYWEKATLAHVEHHRSEVKISAERLSRHWYDLYCLSDNLESLCSEEAHNLLKQVVQHKKEFYPYAFANYDDCNAGKLRLTPKPEFRKFLTDDFSKMTDAGMFYKEPPKFEMILDRLQTVEDAINESIKLKR